jgi:hypothetical protein
MAMRDDRPIGLRHIELHRIDRHRLTPAQWDAVMTLAADRARLERAQAVQAMLRSLVRFCRRLPYRLARRLRARTTARAARSATGLLTR